MIINLLSGVNINGLEALEGVNWDVGDESVDLVGRIFVFVTFAVNSDTNTVLDVTDTMLPDSLVQAGVDSDV